MNKIINNSFVSRSINLLTKKGNRNQATKIVQDVCNSLSVNRYNILLCKNMPLYLNKKERYKALTTEQRQVSKLKDLISRKGVGKTQTKILKGIN